MLSRIRIALGLGLLLSLLTSVTVFSKGGFDYITISGPDLKEAVLVNDIALTEDFFTFANFYEDRTEAPADPGVGYEILRYYKEGVGARAFDRLHYYPESGFVFYDGIENGESEYDGEWYIANPEIKPILESTLAVPGAAIAPREKGQTFPSASQLQPEESTSRATPVPSKFPSLSTLLIVIAVGLAGVFTAMFWRRKTSV